jgi:hemoglobin
MAESTLYERVGGHEGILKLIRPFYADVRQHAVLGPIFNAHIQDWPVHLEKITEFWARQMGGPSSYPGGFAGAHLRLGIGPEHFKHWQTLWDFNCKRNLPAAEAAEASELAHRLGEQLERIVGGRGGLRIG